MKRKKLQLSKFGRRVFEEIGKRGWNIYDLVKAIEDNTGQFVDARLLKWQLMNGKRMKRWVYEAVRKILSISYTDEETYRAWKADLAHDGVEPEVLLARYEAAGMTDYVKQVRAFIRRMEGVAQVDH